MTFRSDEQLMLKTGRPPHTSRFFFLLLTSMRWPRTRLAKMGACRSQNAFSGLVGWCSIYQDSFWGARVRRNQWRSVMRITRVSVFYLIAEIELWSSKGPRKSPLGIRCEKTYRLPCGGLQVYIINSTDNANFGDIWLQLGSKVLSCVSSASPPPHSEFSRSLPFSRWLSKGFSNDNKNLHQKIKTSLENAHLRAIVTVWRLSHCFSQLLNAGKVGYNWFEVNAVGLNTEKERLTVQVTWNILGNLVFLSQNNSDWGDLKKLLWYHWSCLNKRKKRQTVLLCKTSRRE